MNRSPAAAAKRQIHQAVLESMGRLVAEGKLPAAPIPAFSVQITQDPAYGDYSTNAALVIGKELGLSPDTVSDMIQSSMELSDSDIQSCTAIKPGFLNFTMHSSWGRDIVTYIFQTNSFSPSLHSPQPQTISPILESMQLCHARICGVIKNLSAEGFVPTYSTHHFMDHLGSTGKRLLYQFAEYYEKAPNQLLSYADRLMNLFRQWSIANPVRCEDKDTTQARMCLWECARIVYHNLLISLGQPAPEIM